MRTSDGMEIRLRRLSARVSQEKLAKAAGLTGARLCRFECGNSARLSAEEVSRLKAALLLLVAEREVEMAKAIS
jgi:transcriptional regulator with XRE-family HTH domain